MIELSEQLLSLTEAASLLPQRRKGRKPHVSTLYRWTEAGCRGVKLESIQVGGTRCTSPQALQRFIDRLTSHSRPADVDVSRARGPRSSACRRRAAEAAGRELERGKA